VKLIFAGTPPFAERALDALVHAGLPVALVLTRPDQAAGRGQQLRASAVKQRALDLGLPLFQPASLREHEAQARLGEIGADAMVVAAYGLILPETVLRLPRFGCLNIHASLLPRWRGAAPIQRAIEAGDTETGVTIMQMDAGLDTGPMLLSARTPIGADESAGALQHRLAEIGADLIVTALARLQRGDLPPVVQPEIGVTYARKLTRAEAVLDWHANAAVLSNRIRAFDPVPGCVTALAGRPGEPIKVWCAREIEPASTSAATAVNSLQGTVVSAHPSKLVVACGQGTLELLELQKAGGKRLPAAQFLTGFPISAGQQLI
jgi:methionyl-tRNA formyltransferase